MSEFSHEIIGWSRDGSKEVRFRNCHVLCSKMTTYLEAIPSIRYSLATVLHIEKVHLAAHCNQEGRYSSNKMLQTMKHDIFKYGARSPNSEGVGDRAT